MLVSLVKGLVRPNASYDLPPPLSDKYDPENLPRPERRGGDSHREF